MLLYWTALIQSSLVSVFCGAKRNLYSGSDDIEIQSRDDVIKRWAIAVTSTVIIYFCRNPYVDLIFNIYLCYYCVPALTTLLAAFIKKYSPVAVNHLNLICLISSTVVAIWFTSTKHWIPNDILGFAFVFQRISTFRPKTFALGCFMMLIDLSYDIIFTFLTNITRTTQEHFRAPNVLLFSENFYTTAVLGTVDVMTPGIFLAMLLRIDQKLKTPRNIYFTSGMVTYLAGLLVTVAAMQNFEQAQAALFYVVPMCFAVTFLVALMRGEVKKLWSHTEVVPETKSD